jgi:NADPH-dependent 7-cyano-7-deazaguanine reductase QueF-like protein
MSFDYIRKFVNNLKIPTPKTALIESNKIILYLNDFHEVVQILEDVRSAVMSGHVSVDISEFDLEGLLLSLHHK